jgi:TolA-binding protein
VGGYPAQSSDALAAAKSAAVPAARAAPEAPLAFAPSAGAAASVAPAARAALVPRPQPAPPADFSNASELDPPHWIEAIRALYKLGRLDEAQRSLRQFRARYPSYPLPEDLRAQP